MYGSLFELGICENLYANLFHHLGMMDLPENVFNLHLIRDSRFKYCTITKSFGSQKL